ncbi:tyrosine-type recombinase/integrase [Acinetobacter baumannii]|uniref:Tyrosine-type recombinase/integrase n=3 Tax=Acinetobacter baumannii TaxID=470 RepID=A0A8I0KCB8_ACIBA|nr:MULTISPECIES: tyrosine-type recombinase/integrase [Acinetobacter calcoaceticus/baumannii complex]EHU2882667.1 tyrosine-type recombinase/integrase [Acinetobacter baumannii]EHU3107299.1 tyrosine-type recombinase/integrase [Acinetobacter baumannii]EHU3332423.1 tyrosine-type recombinase/integrase [Acinetobacter baumannii]MBD0189805.1 tyrosine-type recombinase/integrase [Acinetobacter baumannii]MBD0221810.1 tyrosine-type recombinase/integrase [Acinetobacter baumannii]
MKRSEIKRRPLSDTTLANLEPELKEYRELDGNGLYFRVKPDGNKSWQLRYKKPNGKWSWLGMGGYPEIGGQLARKKAQELIADIGKGENPIITKQERKQKELENNNATFEVLAKEWLNTKQNRWVAATMTRNKGALEKHIFPTFGKRLYTSIRPIEWMNHLKGIQQEYKIFEQVHRIRAMCRDIYDYAKVTGRIDYNPLEGLHKFLEQGKKENMAHVDEKELPQLLRAIDNYPTLDSRIGLKLLCMLFCRPSELREATWDEFDLENAVWNIPEQRMKKRREHIIPLPTQAVQLLHELKPLSGQSEYLFPSRTNSHKPKSDTVFIMALRRLGYEGRQTPHGFRHIASTLLNNKGFDERHIEAALAHVKDGVAGVYNKAQYLNDRKYIMQWYADHLEQLMDDQIIQFKRG